jgi:hypothetical protein
MCTKGTQRSTALRPFVQDCYPGGVCRAPTQAHDEHTPHGASLNRLGLSATLHCLTGCVTGEVTGMAIATALG